MPSTPRKTFRQAAIQYLQEKGPTHYRVLTREVLNKGWIVSSSDKPEGIMNKVMTSEIQRSGDKSEFVSLGSGMYGLRTVDGSDMVPNGQMKIWEDEYEQRVRIPFFPTYKEVRHLLKIWRNRPRRQVTGLHTALRELSGTPQQSVDWTSPDEWISERLTGKDRKLAEAIWFETNKKVNPRHTYGHWLLIQKYDLMEDGADGNLQITDQGQDFLKNKEGDTERLLDEQEGLIKLLTLIADNGPTRQSGILDEWIEYLHRYSSFKTQSVCKEALWRRLSNLLDRGFIDRKSVMYSITDIGVAWLQQVGVEDTLGGGKEQTELWTLAKNQKDLVREDLRKFVVSMDPIAFEYLVKYLLEEMNYQNVQVTKRSGDGGVDIVADIELGITSVREVVQTKRHRNNIQRTVLDALRGSLHRFGAVRGTIITASKFAKGTKEAAFENGAAPITLIDGDKLIDLLIEYGIGVRKRTLDILEIDSDALVNFEQEPEIDGD